VSGWWSYLDDDTREAVDANIESDRRFMAVKAVWEALRPIGLSLCEAEEVVHARYAALGDRVRHAQPDALDLPSLVARAAAHPGRVAAVEALWDGDTVHDWFVTLIAVLNDPSGEGNLATVYSRPDRPAPGAAATEAGQALAHHLNVPFHFPSPDLPDDNAPRWRPLQPSQKAR
jgi:hypothetical protein